MTSWIPWSGGECPVAEDARVDIKMRDGWIGVDTRAGKWSWGRDADESEFDITAYRVLSAPNENARRFCGICGQESRGAGIACCARDEEVPTVDADEAENIRNRLSADGGEGE